MAQIIPQDSPVFLELTELADNSKVVVFSGLPGVGKSLYVQEFQAIAQSKEIAVDVIQWDVARKAFETSYILAHYPMGDGTVHNGLKLIAGKWLLVRLKQWIEANRDNKKILLIEAPLVGHRFIELVKVNADKSLETFLSSDQFKVVMPIPSRDVRQAIESARADQVKEDAQVWLGAKPSVMLMLWKMTCGIANEFGMDIDMSGQPPYNPAIYEYVFSEILKHRHFVPLYIDALFDVPPQSESELHTLDSFIAEEEEANALAKEIIEQYSESEIDHIVDRWYLS
jgi:hypothetical protein